MVADITMMMQFELNNLAHWFPFVERAGVPHPKTIVLKTDLGLLSLIDCIEPEGLDGFVTKVREACAEVGYPAFLRTGHTSGKHDWSQTCYVPGPDHVLPHMCSLIEYSEMCSFIGLPLDTWVVREYLPCYPMFHAFCGMPMRLERRYFVRDGKVVCHHPYWPKRSIKDPTDPKWENLLEGANRELPNEIEILTKMSERVAREIGGAWSVDWMWVSDRGWVCIDMATFDESFHWDDCPNVPERQRPIKRISKQVEEAFSGL